MDYTSVLIIIKALADRKIRAQNRRGYEVYRNFALNESESYILHSYILHSYILHRYIL